MAKCFQCKSKMIKVGQNSQRKRYYFCKNQGCARKGKITLSFEKQDKDELNKQLKEWRENPPVNEKITECGCGSTEFWNDNCVICHPDPKEQSKTTALSFPDNLPNREEINEAIENQIEYAKTRCFK